MQMDFYFSMPSTNSPVPVLYSGMDTMLTILIAEDNEDDIQLLQMALQRAGLKNPVHVCRDGDDVIDYLRGEGRYSDRQQYAFPRLLISDLKMPKMSGLEVLRWVRDHPRCAVIPTIILSTSILDSDIQEAYELGANAYITKPQAFAELQVIFRDLFAFWGHCQLPDIPRTSGNSALK
jgi:CheY-like chemotaxis protein